MNSIQTREVSTEKEQVVHDIRNAIEILNMLKHDRTEGDLEHFHKVIGLLEADIEGIRAGK